MRPFRRERQRRRSRKRKRVVIDDDTESDESTTPPRKKTKIDGNIMSYMPFRVDMDDVIQLPPYKDKDKDVAVKRQTTLDETSLVMVCSICMDPCDCFTSINGCGDKFHEKCIIEWARTYALDNPTKPVQCPNCRKPYSEVHYKDPDVSRDTVVGPSLPTKTQEMRVTITEDDTATMSISNFFRNHMNRPLGADHSMIRFDAIMALGGFGQRRTITTSRHRPVVRSDHEERDMRRAIEMSRLSHEREERRRGGGQDMDMDM